MPNGDKPPPSPQSQRPASQQPSGSQALADLLKLLSSIPSSSDYQVAEEIFNEMAGLRVRLQTKEKELEQVRIEKTIAVKEMFQVNEEQSSKQKETASEIESLSRSVQEGKDTISQKEREIRDSEDRYKKVQVDYTKAQSTLNTAQRDIDSLQHKLKEKDVLIDKIKSSHSDNLQRLKAAEGEAKEIRKEKSVLTESLQTTNASLDKIKGYAAPHSGCDEDSMVDAFIELWQYATTEINLHLNKDLSEAVLQNHSIWDGFKRKSNLAAEHHVPLPQSNSPAAKQMRLAVFLAILAREVDRQIFQPTYIVPEDAGVRDTLARLAACDNEKESFCRSILLSIDPDREKTILQSRIQAVVRHVSSYLYDMLPEDQFPKLRASIGKIAERAADVWHPFQRSLERYEPDFEPLKWGDDKWSPLHLPEGSSAESETSPNPLDDCLITVFPRITVVERANRFPLTYVVQLRKSHPQCLAAGRELANVPTSPILGRVASNRSRRRSNAPSDAGHANGTLPMKTRLQAP
ncbi:uncharacterized protein BO97DRAFT_408683 [Aspergillus homomorphus CBS 101889]|uniref:MEI5 protein n=1 Tax=Aspergillus homomorphus (strain CBS 101889) TaxID=1450537 RepID=A0A395HJC2_ASPHC|nr:hypothetical protein BO97DRAFT_408683 [Aspergillus homomorphus CBS 101889]RAL07870.1 hypothetical protein BO97DRAFT_408683 [Aspergillus homomorphus CBS 101889]